MVPKQSSRERTAEEISVDRGRWAFVGLALGTLAAYVTVVCIPIVKIAVQVVQEKRQEIDAREPARAPEESEEDIEATIEAATVE